ncbi:MAG: hypothetical protein JWP44_4524 [Mucilaginibacter sp.]|nr:hypothetical protein [Mucilaginibacter sp.]
MAQLLTKKQLLELCRTRGHIYLEYTEIGRDAQGKVIRVRCYMACYRCKALKPAGGE